MAKTKYRETCYICGEKRDGSHQSYCRSCNSARSMDYAKRNAEKFKAYQKKWWTENKDKAKVYKRRSTLKANYGITLEEYDAMLAAQGGNCAICLKPPSTGKGMLYVDHHHESGRLRELLCGNCNFALGQLGEDVDVARRLVEYLLRHNHRMNIAGGAS